MSFQEAVKSALSKYTDFSGRARRSEYWFFALFSGVINLVLDVLDKIIGTPILAFVFGLAMLLPGLAVGVRRLHDIGRSGWWVLLGFLIIIGWIILIVWYCQDSAPDNEYGPSPKGLGGGFPPGGQPGYGQPGYGPGGYGPGGYGQQPPSYGQAPDGPQGPFGQPQ